MGVSGAEAVKKEKIYDIRVQPRGMHLVVPYFFELLRLDLVIKSTESL